jgi:hypothetical protein
LVAFIAFWVRQGTAGRRVMEAIKGNIAAIPISTGERIFFDIK